jgi:hypothetical protein
MLFFAPLLLGVATFPDGDFTHHFLPFSLFQHQALVGFTLPVWNPYTYSGHPFLADVQAAVFYPVSNVLLLLTWFVRDAAARLYLLQVEAAVQVILGGWFAGLLGRALTGRLLGGLVAGLAFAFSGYLTGYPPLQLAVLRTAVWLPLILWCVLRAWAKPGGWAWWLGAGLALAVAFLAGHPQTYLLISYTLVAWLLWLAWFSRGAWGRQLAGVLLMVAVAAGVAAAQWLPSLEYLRLSVRASVDYAYASGGFPIQDTWQVLLPGVLTHYSPLYVGVVGLELAVCAVVWAAFGQARSYAVPVGERRLSWRAGIGFFGGLALAGLLLSYGDNGFLYPLFYRIAPGWQLFRGQERSAYLVALGLAVLAGYGAALAAQMPALWRRRAALIAGALTVAGVYAFGMLWQLPGRTAIGPNVYLLIAAMTLVLGMATALLMALPGWTIRRSVALLALLAANLMWANMMTNLEWVTPAQRVQEAPEVIALQAAVAQGPAANGLPRRVYNEFRIYDDYGMRHEIEDVWGSSPLRLARYAALFAEFPLDRMWRLLGVGHVLTWRRELFGPSELLGEWPQSADTTYLHRLPDVNPRAWLVGEVMVASDAEAWAKLADHQFDLAAAALVPPDEAGRLEKVSPGAHEIALAQVADNRLRVHVNSEGGGLLVLAENWMPGWQVTELVCDDSSACRPEAGLFTPLRVNLTLVGLFVPPGEVRFDLVYAPVSVQWGLWIGGATLAAMVMTLVVLATRRRRG